MGLHPSRVRIPCPPLSAENHLIMQSDSRFVSAASCAWTLPKSRRCRKPPPQRVRSRTSVVGAGCRCDFPAFPVVLPDIRGRIRTMSAAQRTGTQRARRTATFSAIPGRGLASRGRQPNRSRRSRPSENIHPAAAGYLGERPGGRPSATRLRLRCRPAARSESGGFTFQPAGSPHPTPAASRHRPQPSPGPSIGSTSPRSPKAKLRAPS
jgi:hypothetical protein